MDMSNLLSELLNVLTSDYFVADMGLKSELPTQFSFIVVLL